MTLDLLVSRTLRNKFLFFISHAVCHVSVSQPKQTKAGALIPYDWFLTRRDWNAVGGTAM